MNVNANLSRIGHRLKPALAAALLLILPACNGEDAGRPPRYPASGKVLVDGKPEPGIRIQLHPIGHLHDVDAFHPSGVTEGDGAYHLGTYEQSDGAPAGRYKATLFWPDSPDPQSRPRDLFNGAYTKPESSPFEISITEGDNPIGDIKATRSNAPAKPGQSPRRKAAPPDAGPGPDGPSS